MFSNPSKVYAYQIERSAACPACGDKVEQMLLLLKRSDGHYDALCDACSLEVVKAAERFMIHRMLDFPFGA